MIDTHLIAAPGTDDHVDEVIAACLSLEEPRSFFLYAGAGSGKTGSLIRALDRLRAEQGRRLWLNGQRIGVITYTNAACDEIKHRLQFDPIVEVSTIHSFAWSVIGGYGSDIKEWLRANLAWEVAELVAQQAKGRPNTKAAAERVRKIEGKQRRLVALDAIERFVYSATGDNRGRDALSHSEVIKMTSDFLKEKPTLQRILISRYPILLIDESQDTNRHLMDAFMLVQQQHRERFSLGLFGDTMQRIYADGKTDLESALPEDWARPAKQMNHRCPHRVIKLINRIRADVDGQVQKGRPDKPTGIVRLFVLPNDLPAKLKTEARIAKRMAEITGDRGWCVDGGRKTLILEHHMAARRMGFDALFEPLYRSGLFGTGLLDGSLPGLRFFSHQVLPLVQAMQRGDAFAVAANVRKYSPLVGKAALRVAQADQTAQLKKAKLATESLHELWTRGSEPTFLEVLRTVTATQLFDAPETLRPLAVREGRELESDEEGGDENRDLDLNTWEQALSTPFGQIEAYANYVEGRALFDTHQGVKGLEFPRVMVVISDEEARGFLFSYEKLLGAKEMSATDRKRQSEGEETAIDRTRRLFYVTCSRATESLAVIAYSADPEAVRAHAIDKGWFEENEVELVTSDSVRTPAI